MKTKPTKDTIKRRKREQDLDQQARAKTGKQWWFGHESNPIYIPKHKKKK